MQIFLPYTTLIQYYPDLTYTCALEDKGEVRCRSPIAISEGLVLLTKRIERVDKGWDALIASPTREEGVRAY